jgi:hypothetical protein
MSDCANVEMRELLPELAAGTVDAATRARVDNHLATCAECASELDTLRLVRSAFAGAPAIDTSRIVAALPKPPRVLAAPRRDAKVVHWLDWRIAAALTTITVGGLSLAVSQRARVTESARGPDSVEVASPLTAPSNASSGVSLPNNSVPRDTQIRLPAARSSAPVTPRASKPQLSFGEGTGDLDDASLRELLGALDDIDRAPVAPSAEPDRTPVLPVIKSGDR